MKRITGMVGLAAAAVSGGAMAQSIDPASYAATIGVGETVTINKTITLPAAGATKVDVFFLVDDTGSMGSTIGAAKSGATAVMNALPSSYRFGVAGYDGDPSEGVTAANAFNLHQALTTDKTAVQAGINLLVASGGGDTPEASNYALKQAADTLSWAAASQRIVVWFGDAPGHINTTTTVQAADALVAAGAKVVAFNNTSAGNGIDGRDTNPAGDVTNQASYIIGRTGGSLTNGFNASTDFVSAVTSQISAASSSLDLVFGSTYGGDGLGISFTCTDALGCTDVAGGASRTFSLAITGLKPGDYKFDVFARGVDAIESDMIKVTGVVPEPETYALMALGLAMIGVASRRRRNGTRA